MLMHTLVANLSDGDVIAIGGSAILVTLKVGAPILGIGLIVGLMVAVFQAVTQIQEQTLVFIPKIIAIVAVLAVLGPWMLGSLMDFTTALISDIPSMVAKR